MKVITKTITNVELTEEEINVLNKLSNIDCSGVLCSKCPLNGHVDSTINICISSLANRILMKEGIKFES